MTDNDEDRGRSSRSGAEGQGWSITDRVLGGQAIGRSMTPCVVCIVHIEMRSTNFLVEPQNKIEGFLVWALEPPAPVW
jgi:hypothetical protein